ncbi:MAG: hypothetical protein ACM3SR_11430 [Ignavibacteriales bacterium]
MIDVQERDPFGGLITRGNFLVLVDESDSDNIYVGQAQIDSEVTGPVWQILKIEVDGTTTAVKWADGSDRFDKVWNSRGDYSYS